MEKEVEDAYEKFKKDLKKKETCGLILEMIGIALVLTIFVALPLKLALFSFAVPESKIRLVIYLIAYTPVVIIIAIVINQAFKDFWMEYIESQTVSSPQRQQEILKEVWVKYNSRILKLDIFGVVIAATIAGIINYFFVI